MSIQIRRAHAGDAPAISAFMADPEVFGGLLQQPYPSEAAWRQRLDEAESKGITQLVAELNGAVVACAGLHPASTCLRRRHVASVGIGVAKQAQGQGVGSALMAALLSYADQWGQILRIELEVYCDNEAAIALYKKFGFDIEGRKRGDALRFGHYVDSFSMARLHPQPPSWQAAQPGR